MLCHRHRALVLGAVVLLGGAALALPVRADRLALLDGDTEAMVERVRLAVEARQRILASTFIVGDDPLTFTALALLRDAARRGVEVRLLCDAQWRKAPKRYLAHLVEEGVQIRLYHPFRISHLGWISRRLHDKLLIVDGRSLIVGGRNIESPYFGFGSQIDRRDYLDLDVLLEGAVAADAEAYFERVWSSDHVVPFRGRVGDSRLRAAAADLDRRMAWLEERIEAGRARAITPPDGDEVGEIRFLRDPIGAERGEPGVGRELLALLDQAEREVLIESPYLVPSRAFRKGLRRARERGVHVRILTNSLHSTDNLWAQAGYAHCRRWVLRQGVELWEYWGPTFPPNRATGGVAGAGGGDPPDRGASANRGARSLHAKAAVIDERRTIVGSFNLDPRSERLNSEVAVVIDDAKVAATVAGLFEEHLLGARRLDERGFPEGSNRRYPGIPRAKVMKLRLMRLLAPFIKTQL